MVEKQKMQERQSEMGGALRELADDLRYQKEENQKLREKLSTGKMHRPLSDCSNMDNNFPGCPKIDKLVSEYKKENNQFVQRVATNMRLHQADSSSFLTEEEAVRDFIYDRGFKDDDCSLHE